jgi:hypothetical protein
MKQPLVQHNPTYEANMSIDNLAHLDNGATQNIYDVPSGITEPRSSPEKPEFDGGAHPDGLGVWGASPPPSPSDSSDVRPFAADLDLESSDNVNNARRDMK